MRSDVYQDYFQWLCEMVHIDQEDRSYWILAKDLHQHPFYSLIPHDENRASDGLELREDYLHFINYPKYVSIDGECTVFEMLVALARRMDFETSDPYDKDDYNDRTAYWFWEMMDNLGLIVFSDDCYVEYDGMAVAADHLIAFMVGIVQGHFLHVVRDPHLLTGSFTQRKTVKPFRGKLPLGCTKAELHGIVLLMFHF